MITRYLAESLLCCPLLQVSLCTRLLIPLIQVYPQIHAEDLAYCLHCVGHFYLEGEKYRTPNVCFRLATKLKGAGFQRYEHMGHVVHSIASPKQESVHGALRVREGTHSKCLLQVGVRVGRGGGEAVRIVQRHKFGACSGDLAVVKAHSDVGCKDSRFLQCSVQSFQQGFPFDSAQRSEQILLLRVWLFAKCTMMSGMMTGPRRGHTREISSS